MEHRKKILILAIATSLALGVQFGYETLRAPDISTVSHGPAASIRMRNATWGTHFESWSLPYEKNDLIEILIVPENGSDVSISLEDETAIEKYLSGYTIRGGETSKSEPIRITGTARSGNGTENIASSLERDLRAKIQISTWTGKDIVPKTSESANVRPSLTNIHVTPDHIPKGMSSPIRLEWATCSLYPYVMIGETFSKTKEVDWNCYAFVDPDSLSTGEYAIWLQDTDGKLHTISQNLVIGWDSSDLQVAQVTPNEFGSSEDTYIVLQGKGFSKAISAQLSNTVIIRNAEFRTLNDQIATIKIPKGLPPGEYGINFLTQNSITSPTWAIFRISK